MSERRRWQLSWPPQQRQIERVQGLALDTLCLLVLLALGLYLRWPAMDATHFANADIAGITYNADLLRHGQAPMVDNLEYKAPGSFFATWAVWQVTGRSLEALIRFTVLWTLLAGIGVFLGGRLLYGRGAGLAAGLLYVLASPITDGLAPNYNTWMITAYIWATVLFVAGLRSGKLLWIVACGALVTFAALLKRQGGMIAPLFAAIIALGPLLQRSGWPPLRRRPALLAYLGGLALGGVPIFAYYLASSGISGLWTFWHHFFFSPAGWSYVAGEVFDSAGTLDRIEDGLLGFPEFMALSMVLTTMTVAAVPLRRTQGWTVRGLLLGGHLICSVVGLSLGWRFYMGYYLQALPAACWLAAHPDGPLLRWFQPEAWPSGAWRRLGRGCWAAGMLLLLLPAAVQDLSRLKKARASRLQIASHELGARQMAAVIKKNTKPSDGIWVWGRWAWPVYYYSDRLSCTRYYKVLSLITTDLDNTWRRPTRQTVFDGRGPWRDVGRELAQCKPAYIVAARNESYRGFEPLERLLREEYEREPSYQSRLFDFYRRKKPPPPGAAKRGSKATARPPAPRPRRAFDRRTMQPLPGLRPLRTAKPGAGNKPSSAAPPSDSPRRPRATRSRATR